MDIYFGGCDRPNAIHTLAAAGGKKIMISYAYPPSPECWRLFARYGLEILADSGAFTAWKRGDALALDGYIDWLGRHGINDYFNLDAVGDPEATAENQRVMEKQGLTPIPVFHYGENYSILGDMVTRYKLVGLGGHVGLPVKAKETWFRDVYSMFPAGRFHALGTTNARVLQQFPLASADSSWWLYRFRDNQARHSDGSPKDERAARVRYLMRLEQLGGANRGGRNEAGSLFDLDSSG